MSARVDARDTRLTGGGVNLYMNLVTMSARTLSSVDRAGTFSYRAKKSSRATARIFFGIY